MQMTAAVVKEQGVTFAVVLVKDHVVLSPSTSQQMLQAAASHLGCHLVVLMGEHNHRLQGNRKDVVDFVANLHPSQLPWRKWR